MKRMSKEEHEHVHLNFKVAVIATFFFLLLFEIHNPVFKPKMTGNQIYSLGHWDKVDPRCECPPGTSFIESHCQENPDEKCRCYDNLQEIIVPGRCV